MNTALRNAFIALDRLLTGKTDAALTCNAANQPAIFEDPASLLYREYYLADGGYSRIFLDDEARLWLTSNSRDQVRERWHATDVQPVKAEIERIVASLLLMATHSKDSSS